MITDPGSGDTIAFFYTTDINERMIYQKITGRIISGNFETVGYLDIGNEKLYLRNNAEDSDTLFTVYDWQEALKKALGGFIAKSKESGAVNGIDLESIVTHLEKEDVYTQYFTTTIKRSDLPHSPFKKIKNDWFYLDENKDMYDRMDSGETSASCVFWFKLDTMQTLQCEEVTCRSFYDRDGNRVGIYCVGQNITARKLNEEKYNNMCASPIGQAIYGVLFQAFSDKIYMIILGAMVICLLLSYFSKRAIGRIGKTEKIPQ